MQRSVSTTHPQSRSGILAVAKYIVEKSAKHGFPLMTALRNYPGSLLKAIGLGIGVQGGAYIGWYDGRAGGGTYVPYCQHVGPDGSAAPGWPASWRWASRRMRGNRGSRPWTMPTPPTT